MKELHGKFQQMPEITGTVGQRQPSLPLGQHHGSQPGDNAGKNKRDRHGQAKICHPVGMLTGQNIVQKNLAHHWACQPRNDGTQFQNDDKKHCPAVMQKFFRHILENIVAMTGGLKIRPRLYKQGHACIRCAKFFPRHSPPPHSRVV